MGLHIFFVFSDADEGVLYEAVRKWPGTFGQTVNDPFRGIAFRTPDLLLADSDEELEHLYELGFAVRDGLPGFSSGHPDKAFVFLLAECHGGACVYEGYACRDGRKFVERDGMRGDGTLTRLVAPLGVKLKRRSYRVTRWLHRVGVHRPLGEDFAPLQRGFFRSSRAGAPPVFSPPPT